MSAVAIFDDDPVLIELYTTILQEEGYSVLTMAVSGETATLLAHINQLQAALLILDIRMPGVRSFEIVQALQAQSDHLRPKVIVCSAARQDMADLEKKLLENNLPVPALLEKPFDLDEFIELVEKLIGKA